MATADDAEARRSGTQAVERAFAVLTAVSESSGNGITLPAITEAVGLHRTTTHRILKCLMDQGAVRLGAGAKYFLGPFALQLGSAARRHFNVKDILEPALERLASVTGDTVFLLERRGDDSICVDRRSGAYPVKTLIVEVGTRRPLGVGAAGLLLVQHLSDDELAELVRRNAPRYGEFDTNAEAVTKAVQRARKRDSIVAAAQGVPGVTAIAVAVRDRALKTIAVLAITAIDQRMTPSRQKQLLKLIHGEIERAEPLLTPP